MNPRKSLLLYLLVVFCLGLILFLFLVLRNLQINFGSDRGASEARQFSFHTEIVSVNTFYKNQQYEQALALLARFDEQDLSAAQKHAAEMMRAACHKALGLYTTALEDVDRAARSKETSFSHFMRGLIFEASGSEVNAIGAFQDALRLDAEYAPAQERIGDIHFRSGNYEKAFAAYTSKKKSDRPLSDSALLKQAVCRYFLGQDAEAGRLSGLYLAKAKNQKDMEVAYLIRALSFSAQGQTREAEEAHEKAIAVAQVGSRAFLKYYYALYLLRQKNYSQAVKLLEEISFVDGDRNAVANYTLGQIYFRSQDFEKSLRYFDRNRQWNTDQPDLYYYAASLYQLGRIKESLNFFELIRLRKKVDEYTLSATLLSSLCLARLGRMNEAEASLNEAMSLWKNDKRVVNTLAYLTLYYDPGHFLDRVSPYFDQKNYPEVNLFLADYYLGQGKTQSALSVLVDYLQRFEAQPRIYKICGDLSLRLRDYKNAEDYYQDAIARSASSEEKNQAKANMAYSYYYRQDVRGAEKILDGLLKENPSHPGYLYNAAILAKAKGNEALFMERVDLSLKYLPDFKESRLASRVYQQKAALLLEEGRRQGALAALEKAVELDPKNQSAEFELKKLQ